MGRRFGGRKGHGSRAGRSGGRGISGLPDDVRDLWKLTVTYARQETLEPLKALGRFLAYGLAGSVALSLGLVLLLLGGLRALQSETGSTFTGNWSWVPYLLTLVAAALAGGAAVAARGRGVGRRPQGGRR